MFVRVVDGRVGAAAREDDTAGTPLDAVRAAAGELRCRLPDVLVAVASGDPTSNRRAPRRAKSGRHREKEQHDSHESDRLHVARVRDSANCALTPASGARSDRAIAGWGRLSQCSGMSPERPDGPRAPRGVR